ncbi:M28 family peptidase [Pedobacter sp. SL55]|uniref:M28 family peptidase n=1 Tax=Pedobacter sp. SL55 TaxID=2995161 RepID=UPI00227162A6|nr:M28 family peptidase [Pedobacter sp. SL55]WAC41476.1 M28 family peptidase [Pedobacter sp. SL55]
MIKISTFLWLTLFSFCCSANTDTVAVKKHLKNITKTASYRNPENLAQLNSIAYYIKTDFLKYSDKVSYQEYKVDGKIYKNVICSFGTENQQRIIVGAHYDVCGDQEGADDNASGVVGLLELARQLKGRKLNKRIDLVAYTLEEPPYFRTEQMGSYVHAKSLKDNKVDVLGMISLEMIGYFSDKENSQNYPLAAMSKVYGNKGDYITLVNTTEKGKFVEDFSQHFKQAKTIKTEEFNAPRSLPGIDFSDHLNYWNFGYSAMMITDTSFYRNKNYHRKTDKMETLDIRRMAKVIDGVYLALLKLTK